MDNTTFVEAIVDTPDQAAQLLEEAVKAALNIGLDGDEITTCVREYLEDNEDR